MVLGIVSDAIGIFFNARSNYYWYNLGKNTSGIVMKSFILVDYLAAW